MAAEGFAGANVTVPHKGAALALADTLSETAREIGAANTLSFARADEIRADNTDAGGLLAALPASPRRHAGAGPRRRRAPARAVVWALPARGRGSRSGTAPRFAPATSARSWAAARSRTPTRPTTT